MSCLVDMLQKINPNVDIFYLDTDFHFKETYETRDRLEAHYGMNSFKYSRNLRLKSKLEQFGEELMEIRCEPMLQHS